MTFSSVLSVITERTLTEKSKNFKLSFEYPPNFGYAP